MPPTASRERYAHSAGLILLSVAAFAAGIATLVHWSRPVHQTMDLIVPPSAFAIFLGLSVALKRRPQWLALLMKLALLTGLLALAAPAWFYTWQAIAQPDVRLVDVYPPVTSLLLALMVTVMIFLPARQAMAVVALCWLLIAAPVLGYLIAHPLELRSPRGADLMMGYGPVFAMVAVLLPVQRSLTGRIQQLVSEQARMEAAVNRDPLTQLYNRRFCEHVLQDLLIRQAPVGVIMFDMDRFKAINDTHGHPVGDAVLQRVAQRCQDVAPGDACVARWGGEEFLVVLPHVDAGQLQACGERLRAAIAALTVEPVPQLSASLGLALAQPDEAQPALLQRVDHALYRAKQQGRNRVAW